MSRENTVRFNRHQQRAAARDAQVSQTMRAAARRSNPLTDDEAAARFRDLGLSGRALSDAVAAVGRVRDAAAADRAVFGRAALSVATDEAEALCAMLPDADALAAAEDQEPVDEDAVVARALGREWRGRGSSGSAARAAARLDTGEHGHRTLPHGWNPKDAA